MQKPPDPLQDERHYKLGGMLMTAAATVHGALWIATRNGWFAFGFWLFLTLVAVFSALEMHALSTRLVREQPNRDDNI